MAKFGICGPSYESQSLSVDAQRTRNWYPEISESPDSKSKIQMYPTPGLAVFATLPEGPVRAEFWFKKRYFAIGGSKLCEVTAAGVVTVRGTVATDELPAHIAAGPTMLAIASGGRLYALTLADNTFVEVDTTTGAKLQGAVAQVIYADGFYIALLRDSDKIQLSTPLDATLWDPMDIAAVSVFADNVLALAIDHREVWALGPKAIQPYSNTGNPLFPYDVIGGAFIEQGIIAPDSLAKMDNSIFGLGGDERGAGVAWRAQGYVPARISTEAQENAWQKYPTMEDAVGYTYQDQGHAFYVLWFPSADVTWVYDAKTRMWHERTSLVNGVEHAHLGRCHAFAFNKHLVGDRLSGNIYQMSIDFFDDAGTPIKRVRRAAHLCAEQKRVVYSELQIDLETGIGPAAGLPDGNGGTRAPQLMLRWSDDHTKKWSHEYLLDCGNPGEFRKRVIRRRMGQARDRIFEISTSDPIPWRIVDAYLRTS